MLKLFAFHFFLLSLLLTFSIPLSFAGPPPIMATISPKDSAKIIQINASNTKFKILDVRTPAEFKSGHLADANLLDYYSPTFKKELGKLSKEKTYLIYCRSGGRSGKTLEMMKALGFTKVYNMSGGILGWQGDQLPLVK